MHDWNATEQAIDAAWENRADVSPGHAVAAAVDAALTALDSGEKRVASRLADGQWVVHQWLKKAVLLSFRLAPNALVEGAAAPAFDKVAQKTAGWDQARFADAGFRMVPGAIARRGAYVANDAVLMPSFCLLYTSRCV